MNETATNATPYEEFVWRRLEDPLSLFGQELPWQVWLIILGVVLTAALVYVVWMYIKDSVSVGPYWASLLGLLRTSVYIILAVVFLLPSMRTRVVSTSQGKVLLAFDVSASMHTSDQLPTGTPNEQLPSRMDRVQEFLADKKLNFLQALEAKNPLTIYRLGSRLDENYLHFAGGRVWTREERENPPRDADGNIQQPDIAPLPEPYWRSWLNPQLPRPEGIDLARWQELRLEKLGDSNARLVKEGLLRGTNLGDSLLGILNKEANSRLQGLVLFSDGRNTEGSPNAFRELQARAKAANIPIFVVAVGEDRQKVKLEVVDIRAPQQVQPEDKFRVKGEITGEGLPGEKLDVTLELVHVRLSRVKEKDKDGKVVEREKEEPLPLELIEAENPDDPSSRREKIVLGNKLELKPASDVVLDKSTPPRVEVEWQLDAAALAQAGGIDLNDARYRGRRWELGQTQEDSELRFVLRVPVDKREGLRSKFHESTKVGTQVIKKPIRVLLLASAANRDFQFVQSLLVREAEKKRLEVAICLQVPPGEERPRTGVVMSVPPERLIRVFPDTFRKKKDLYDLSSYDVVVCFDPDWRQITGEQIKLLKEWADKGGGIIMLGSYINTVELIRPRDEDPDRFKPLLELLPVVLDDRRDYIERKTDEPWPLDFEGASPEMEFLKLDDELDASRFKEDWQMFFYGTDKNRSDKPTRGFYSFYPVQQAKVGSVVVARFTDPAARLAKDNSLHPYIVLPPEALPRVVWIGSDETWRLREYREDYHERFWTKLVRYAAARSTGPVVRSIRLEHPTVISAGRAFEVEARIDGPDGQPLDRSIKPQITVKLPAGAPESDIKQPIAMNPRPGVSDGWFTGRFLVRTPGEYEFTVKVPRQPGQESEQAETAKFTVKESNPELDNTRPDYDRLYRLASEADEVLPRMSEGDANELKRRLQRPKLDAGTEGSDRTDIREDRLRLYFDLKNADLIPSCMTPDIREQVSRGRYRDLWDDGVTVYEYPKPEKADEPARQPIKVAYVLLLVVGLLSIEWLTRKLLRLA